MCSETEQPVRRCVRVIRWEVVAEWLRAVCAAVTEAVRAVVPADSVAADADF